MYLLAGSSAAAAIAAPTQTQVALSAADGILTASLAATLAGFSLTAAAFLFRFWESAQVRAKAADDLARKVHNADKPTYQTDADNLKTQANAVKGATDLLVRAALAFLTSLVLILALTDTILETTVLFSPITNQILDTAASGSPFALGIGYLFTGVQKIREGLQ